MTSSQAWHTEGDFLDMFGVDRGREGAKDFADLATATALFYRFPELGCGYYDACKRRLRELRWSPLAFYTRIKRALAPVFAADRQTLEALGLQIEAEVLTVPVLVKAVAARMAESIPDSAFADAQGMAALCSERSTKGGEQSGH